jgi:hypothetical protein
MMTMAKETSSLNRFPQETAQTCNEVPRANVQRSRYCGGVPRANVQQRRRKAVQQPTVNRATRGSHSFPRYCGGVPRANPGTVRYGTVRYGTVQLCLLCPNTNTRPNTQPTNIYDREFALAQTPSDTAQPYRPPAAMPFGAFAVARIHHGSMLYFQTTEFRFAELHPLSIIHYPSSIIHYLLSIIYYPSSNKRLLPPRTSYLSPSPQL